MRAMIFEGTGRPLRLVERPVPEPGPEQVLLRVRACGVCRTDLHIIDGELTQPRLPLILGHEIVGSVERVGSAVTGARPRAAHRRALAGRDLRECVPTVGQEAKICVRWRVFTGYRIDGGYAEYTVADHRYCFPLPDGYDDAHAAPLLCAGLIGYRSYRMAGDARRIGLYGFGAAAHIIAQVALHQGREVYAFTRPGDEAAQQFARELGVQWSGASDRVPPVPLDAAILFAPVGALVPTALAAVRKGGRVVCAGIHMSQIPTFSYSLLWGERSICSVANLTRQDGIEFMAAAAQQRLVTSVETFPLVAANEALARLRCGEVKGAAVLTMEQAQT
ncbi:MAG: zinc-dependent alcohol dehydrogenase family protein [Pseudomonadota bacterium]|nr:MAG: zinc-dependent alcohol dehydrogenase family protein [Pseudomonadota bacterium]